MIFGNIPENYFLLEENCLFRKFIFGSNF